MAANKFHAVHYRLIANALAQAPMLMVMDSRDDAIDALADLFEADNERFDRDRFLAAASGRPTNTKDVIDR